MALTVGYIERWQFSSNCCACARQQGVGLRRAFSHGGDAGLVRASLTFGAKPTTSAAMSSEVAAHAGMGTFDIIRHPLEPR